MSDGGEKFVQDGNQETRTKESSQKETTDIEKPRQKLSKAERIALRNQASLDNSLSTKINYLCVQDESTQNFGEYQLVQSLETVSRSTIVFTSVSSLDKEKVGKQVWIRARVDTIRPKGRSAFLVLRQSQYTLQAVVSESERVSRQMIKWMTKEVGEECLVDIYGSVVAAEVKSCSQHDVELHVWKLYIVNKVKARLPIRVEDAGRPDWQEGVHVLRDTRLDNRVLDLRVPSQQAIFRIQSGVCQLFREILLRESFIEIHSPKIIAGASEGGAEVFKLNYFGQNACLAQSPQLYKQMAICGDLERVFEIGPVFRAENSYTHRHLCEFIGLDIEMAIREHYFEVLDVLERLFIGIFEGICQRFASEIELIQQKFQISPITYLPAGQNPRLHFPEAVQLLRDNGYVLEDLEDLSTENEKALGKIIKEKYGTDFYTLASFPAAVRPFYTMPKADDSRYSNSFDMFLRGEEIVSGAQRIHDSELLETQVKARNIPLSSIEDYINAFKYGTPPHGGAGIGLERVVMLYLGVGNIRECSMFPRDPKRLRP
ncbi:Aspartate--tRNA ligase, cytoplasmic [Galdieria sulphuraria]|nr:Aspartate--tRNA ligase, cytoplasmic [Galdieria sulphuraria]